MHWPDDSRRTSWLGPKRWADLIVPEGGNNTVAFDVLLGQLGRVAFGRD
jgi:hypothetical protein